VRAAGAFCPATPRSTALLPIAGLLLHPGTSVERLTADVLAAPGWRLL